VAAAPGQDQKIGLELPCETEERKAKAHGMAGIYGDHAETTNWSSSSCD
jgi:hypothetical protein